MSASFSPFRVVLTVVPILVLGLGGVYLYTAYETYLAQQQVEQSIANVFGLAESTEHHLEKTFVDADQDLVADLPTGADEQLLPETLVFSPIGGASDAAAQQPQWQPLLDKLSEQTGRPLEYRTFPNAVEQLKALRDGTVHLAAINTGSVPQAVCVSGFVPVAVPSRPDGSFGYQMQIIVPANSPVQKVDDLRGRKVTFTDPQSNSGFKGAVVILAQDFGMRPERDYDWGFSLDHAESIRRVATGELQAAAVASDILDSLIAAGPPARDAPADQPAGGISGDKVRVIYTSETFPPVALGHHHALAPELASAWREVLLSADWAGAGLAEIRGFDGNTQFVPVDYKEAWATVRRIDNTLGVSYDLNNAKVFDRPAENSPAIEPNLAGDPDLTPPEELIPMSVEMPAPVSQDQ